MLANTKAYGLVWNRFMVLPLSLSLYFLRIERLVFQDSVDAPALWPLALHLLYRSERKCMGAFAHIVTTVTNEVGCMDRVAPQVAACPVRRGRSVPNKRSRIDQLVECLSV